MARGKKAQKSYYLYGVHACEAALANDARDVLRMLSTKPMQDRFVSIRRDVRFEVVEGKVLEKLLPAGAVHQGIALEVAALDGMHLDEVMAEKKPLLMLDQVTDPHNVGAILRSAAAFGVAALIVPYDHAPPEGGVMAKAACGAMDMVPIVTVTNLAQTIKSLKEHGYWIAGLDGTARQDIEKVADYMPICVVMGAEGKGLRRLTAELCDILLKIPMDARMESLNVSNAAAITLYELFKTQK